MIESDNMDEQQVYKDKKVLITGGLGFIGSNLARKLVALQAEITLADCQLPDHGANLRNIAGIEKLVHVTSTDIRNRQTIGSLVKEQDYIFSLAAQTFHTDSMKDPFTDQDINCTGQLNILEACRKFNPAVKIVFASTRQVYGQPRYSPLDEKHPCNPVDINGINKLAAEQYHQLYNKVYGIPTVILRLTNTYGPCQILRHSRANFTGWLIRQAINKEEISIFGDGTQIRDFTYIDDVVAAFLSCGADDTANGEIFNLGGEKPYSLLEFTELLLRICPGSSYKLVPFPEERKVIDIGSVSLSYDKIKKYLRWSPHIHLEAGLTKTIDYFKENKNYYF